MINIFRRNKWQIYYVDEIGMPEKVVIISAKTNSQAKEKFQKEFSGKIMIKVKML